MDELEQDPQDPMDAALAKLRAGKPQAAPDMDAALASIRKTPTSPITPGHSKFTADELKARADRSVAESEREAQASMDDLSHTVVDVPLAATAVGEIPALVRGIPQLARNIPALIRGGKTAAKFVGDYAGIAADVATIPVTPRRSLGRLGSRVLDFVAERKAKSAAPPFSSPAPVASTVEGVMPGSGALRTAKPPTPQTTGRSSPPPRSALERQFQDVVDAERVAYEATLHKGQPLIESPPAVKPTTTFRRTGGQSSGRSVADVLRSKRRSP